MSLATRFDDVVAGCVSIPQHGFDVVDPPQQYQVKLWAAGRRTFYRFSYPVWLHWQCPSPPATVNLYFSEHPELTPATDPLLAVKCYLNVCSSPGTYKGTSRWFWANTFQCFWANGPNVDMETIHIQNYKTNAGSIGITRFPFPPRE